LKDLHKVEFRRH